MSMLRGKWRLNQPVQRTIRVNIPDGPQSEAIEPNWCLAFQKQVIIGAELEEKIADLKAKLEKSEADRGEHQTERKYWYGKYVSIEAERDELRSALKFYADRRNWDGGVFKPDDGHWHQGERARKALEAKR